ncbi:glycosyl transferase family protein [Pusillimonas sp. T7-7]|nr:glycosyl transferase family protein [Pusillimonas sp. T7-7]
MVIPLFNELEVLGLMYQKLKAIITPLGISHELLFVDDGSSDGTVEALAKISNNDPAVTVVLLARHFGKESALAAGLAQAGGRAVVTMDGDLQDPPEAIPRMLSAWRHGADVVRMQRQRPAGQSPLKRYASLCLDQVLDAIFDIGMPEDHVDFMLYRQEAVAALGLVAQRKQSMQAMFEWAGFQETVIEYERRPRAAGTPSRDISQILLGSPGQAAPHAYIEAAMRSGMLFGLAMMLASLLYACTAVAGSEAGTFSLLPILSPFSWGGLLFLSSWAGKHIARFFRQSRHPRYAICRLERARTAAIIQQTWV